MARVVCLAATCYGQPRRKLPSGCGNYEYVAVANGARAKIPPDLRAQFELYGEAIMVIAIQSSDANRIGQDLAYLGQRKRKEIVEWLQEKRDEEALRFNTIQRWTVSAGVAGIIAAIAAVIAAWPIIAAWLRH